MSFNEAYILWLAGAIITCLWLDKKVYQGGLDRRARLMMDTMIYAASILFPLTWAWIITARGRAAMVRLSRHLSYQRKH